MRIVDDPAETRLEHLRKQAQSLTYRPVSAILVVVLVLSIVILIVMTIKKWPWQR
jgi:hypothetical protein